MKNYLQFVAAVFCLSTMQVGVCDAQSTSLLNNKSEWLQMRERETFTDPNASTIPYEGYTLRDYAERNFPEFGEKTSEMFPIESNRALADKVSRRNIGKQADGNSLETKKEFYDISWGTFTTVEDGKSYVFTQENEKSVPHNPNSAMWYYRSATFTVYNEDFEEIKSFKVASSDTTYSFTLIPDVSYKVFDNDADWEFMVQIHGFENASVGGPESCRDTVLVVNESGEIQKRFYQATSVSINTVRGKYSNTYQLQVSRPYYNGVQENQEIVFYDPKKIQSETDVLSEPVFTYSVPANLLAYTRGPIFYYLDIEGVDYYMATKYEKPFCIDNDPENPVWETDNRYIVTLYDTSFEKVKEISLPLIGQKENNLSLSQLGDFSDYMISRHVFNSDDKIELIYGMNRYYAECDCSKTDYYLVNEDGEVLQELMKEAVGVMKLPSLAGQSDEYAVFQGTADAISSIMMYQVPALEEAFTFPALYQGSLLSLSFTRLAVDDSYQYVFGLGRGEQGDNTVLGGVNYYDTKGVLKKKVRFDLGNKIAAFSPVLDPTTLDPYGFIADEKREYLFFATDYLGNDTFEQRFSIANEDEILYTWNCTTDEIIKGAGVMGDAGQQNLKYFYINIADAIGESNRTLFYSLPLERNVLEGEGTELNPYLIKTASDLNSVREYPEAWFVMENDIDMIDFTGYNGKGFNPIASFSGHLDGKNHVISNLLLNTVDNTSGLFKEITNGGEVKNLQLQKVAWSGLTNGATVGTLAGIVSYSSVIDNCHVSTDINTNIEQRYLGGIAGSLTKSSVMKNSSFTGNISTAAGSAVGGLAGNNHQAEILNSYSEGEITGKTDAGGIVGSITSGGSVKDSYSRMNILASVRIGGIAGNVSGTVENTYASGDVKGFGTGSLMYAGGIAGGAQASVVASPLLKHNVAMNGKVVMPTDAARILSTDIPETLVGNYALSSMLVGTNEDDLNPVDEGNTELVGADKIHGQSVDVKDLNQVFYETMGWKFGKDTENPWVMYENSPHLWFEFVVRGVQVEETQVDMLKGEKHMLKACVVPEIAANQNLRYTSSDLKVASVSSTGEITARGEGVAEITVTSEEGGYKAVCRVSVIIPVSEITLSAEELTLEVNEQLSLTATVMPKDATNTAYYWSSSNSDIVYVYNGTLVGVSAGTADVIVCSEDGYASDTCHVTVVTPISEIYLNESMVSLDKANPTFQLVAKAAPETAVLPSLNWSSDNRTVAQVDQTGLVSGYQKGEAIVTVETEDGKFSASCLVEVLEEIGVGLDMVISDQVRVYVEQDELNIEADKAISSVCVLNSAGQTLYINQAVGSTQLSLPVSDMGTGVLMVRVQCDGHWFVHKVMVK